MPLEVRTLSKSLRSLKLYINLGDHGFFLMVLYTKFVARVKVVYSCNGAVLPVFMNTAAGRVLRSFLSHFCQESLDQYVKLRKPEKTSHAIEREINLLNFFWVTYTFTALVLA